MLHHLLDAPRLNLVTTEPDRPYGCLIRAGDVMGAGLARSRREAKPRETFLPECRLASGPGCVAQCFAADLANDGGDLFEGRRRILLPDGHTTLPHLTDLRVGLSGPAGDGAAFPWRYWIQNAPSVSTSRLGCPHPRPPVRSVQHSRRPPPREAPPLAYGRPTGAR
ncbi:DNA-3-methyladenine glycosylase [Pseudarthrobacter sp. P1]|uniref:DNA-3-methyladenine glycosylase n=1 Tax=Pseudarthrobacter sp. P1 TaxID=3418418 RepID=UPI003CE6F65F